MPAPHRPVDPQQSFPALEEEVLERWRERDVFPETVRRREGAAVGLLRGAADRERPAGHRTTCSRASSRTSSPATRRCAGSTSSARAAGTATACRSRSRSRRSSASPPRTTSRLRDRRVQRAVPRVGLHATSRSGTRLTERIGFWVDLDDAYRTLDTRYIESVWWALKTIWDKGLLYEGYKVVPYCPRCGTALSSPRARQPGATGTWSTRRVYVRFPVTRAGRPAARRRRAAGLDDDAVDARLQRRGRGRSRS